MKELNIEFGVWYHAYKTANHKEYIVKFEALRADGVYVSRERFFTTKLNKNYKFKYTKGDIGIFRKYEIDRRALPIEIQFCILEECKRRDLHAKNIIEPIGTNKPKTRIDLSEITYYIEYDNFFAGGNNMIYQKGEWAKV